MDEPLSVAGRKSDLTGRFFDPHDVDGAVAALGNAQHLVFAVRQLVAIGLSARAAQRRVTAHRLHRVHHGVLSLVPPAALTSNGRRMAAVLACGDGAALSCTDAGKHRALMRWSRANAWEVTVPGRSGRSRPGIIVHRSSTLRPCDVELVEGIPCTTIARTIFDLAEILKPRPFELLLDEAEGQEVLDMTAIDEQMHHNAGRTKAIGILTLVLGNHRIGSTRTDGPIGEALLGVIRAGGQPDPRTQFWIDFDDGEPMVRADFAYPDVKVILEADGGRHRTKRQIERDKRRDQRAACAGWQTLRFTWNQIHHEQRRIIETIRAVRWSRRALMPGSAVG